jgi:hypothetical protein
MTANNTPVKNDKNEYYHLSCADKTEDLQVLKPTEFENGVDLCKECDGTLEVDKDLFEMDDPDEDDE